MPRWIRSAAATRAKSQGEVPATALDWILRGSVPSREFVSAQMGFEVNMSCHASLSTTLLRDPVVKGPIVAVFDSSQRGVTSSALRPSSTGGPSASASEKVRDELDSSCQRVACKPPPPRRPPTCAYAR